MCVSFSLGPLEGCVALLWLIVWLVCLLNIVGSRASVTAKVVWLLLCLFMPPLGLVLWFLFGPRQGRYY